MKKTILILSIILATCTLTAFGYFNWGDIVKAQEDRMTRETPTTDYFNFAETFKKMKAPELVYNIDSRFIATVTKEDLHKATSIVDILPAEATEAAFTYSSSTVSVLEGDKESQLQERGNSDELNDAQLQLLQSADYSTNIFIRSDYNLKDKDRGTGELGNRYLTYYITVVPENEATYVGGEEALIDYLKEGSKEETANISSDQVRPARMNFTVTKEGTITDVKLTTSSGYSIADERLIELITNMPGVWNPATNAKGEKVDQELIFFFGSQGC